ncbi:MAG: bifunctional riboflavin kinase/FAD synthetase [Oscillospiraceae bacterium]|nr:bifunctional riboflavin kinase/FAD synthetase [Clostridiaceae bacterium]MDY5889355.1 bifunctional riboflavin kinase/FAD synthetase [Oscillospiraceae bacterium]MDY5934319.1 bifunctional riboflavin kinase/FAD synthetase [Oscillospiraceae bacterium]
MTDGNNANRTAVALGNFDGMHVGHMAVLEAAKSFESEGLLPVAVLFDEHSLKAITGKAPAMLMTVTERNRIINENGLGIETLVFNEIRDLSPSDFVEKILVGRLGAAAVCCGYNYRFGKGASGTAQTMSEICGRLGLKCRVSGEVDVDRCAVSSTKIRGFIENGEIEKANKMLGRPFGFSSRVIDGDKRGRVLGFPTINQIIPEELAMPRFGVYQSVVTVNGERFKGVTNVGRRPTVGTEKILSETHILDFDRDIYGENVDVRLIKFIRPEKKFSSFDELARQIKSDAKEVR